MSRGTGGTRNKTEETRNQGEEIKTKGGISNGGQPRQERKEQELRKGKGAREKQLGQEVGSKYI